MANYPVSPDVLQKYVPKNTELDFFNNKTYVSLVGFMFLNTRILGVSIPYHINFEEVNLRLYVKQHDRGNWRRGVSFIREIVPKPAIAVIANNVYREKYVTMKMKHHHSQKDTESETAYEWRYKNKWNKLAVVTGNMTHPLHTGSEEEFIAEHYWGFTCVNENTTSVYEVQHPRWEIADVKNYTIDCDFAALFGNEFSFLEYTSPSSIFLAKGSEVKIFRKKALC